LKKINQHQSVTDLERQITEQGYWKNPETQYAWEAHQIVKVSKMRSIYKTCSWRVLATTDTFVISWFITGYFSWAATIASIEVFTKMGLYYFHERLWLRIKFKRPW